MIKKTLGTVLLAAAFTLNAGCGHYLDTKVKRPGLERKISAKDYAVLFVDMQEIFLDQVDFSELKQEISYQLEIIDYCAKHDILVIVLEYEDCGPTIEAVKREVKKVPRHKFIEKSEDDGFSNPKLARQLGKWGVGNVFLMGSFASACVARTAEGALMHGFSIATSSQVIEDRLSWPHDENVEWYSKNGVFSNDYKIFYKLVGGK